MNAPEPAPRGIWFVVIASVLALGAAALDFGAPHAGANLLDRPGAAAVAGVAAALAAVAIAHALRAILGRRMANDPESDDVRNRS